MTILSRIATVVPLLALALPSCGRVEGPPLFPVHGKVIYRGQPAAGASVILRRLDPEPNATPVVPVGQVDDEGNFSVAVDEVGAGAPAGKYVALIQWRTRAEGGTPKPAPVKLTRRTVVPPRPDGVPDRLEGRFMNVNTTPFHIEVKAGENNLEPFDVSKEPPQPTVVKRPNQSVSD